MSRPLTGLSAWIVQRLSAVYLALFTLGAAAVLLTAQPDSHGAWLALWRQPVVAAATALFFIALLLHAWVGLRDVILDYVAGSLGVRLTFLSLLGGWLIVLGIWMLRILWMVAGP